MSARHHSPAWKAVRRRALERDGFRCVKCGRMGDLEVHHHDRRSAKFYDLDAVVTLCRRHHIEAHVGERRKLDPRRAAWAKLLGELRR